MSKEKEVLPASASSSLELNEELIRKRAYELFEQRGYENGHDVDDWLQAETELTEKKPTSSEDETPKEQATKAA